MDPTQTLLDCRVAYVESRFPEVQRRGYVDWLVGYIRLLGGCALKKH